MAKKSENINLSLVTRLNQAKQSIKLLKKELRDSEDKWMIYLFKIIEEELEGYKWMTRPRPFKLHATHSGKPVVYEISIIEVICVISDGRAKYIYLKNPVRPIDGDYHETNKILVNRNGLTLDKLCNEMEGLRFHLVQISKNAAINIACYHLGKNSFQLIGEPSKHKNINDIPLGKMYLDNYKFKKHYFDAFLSLHSFKSRDIQKKSIKK